MTRSQKRLEGIADLGLPRREARKLWRESTRHRRALVRELGRDVGARVALLDYLLNVRGEAIDATIVDRSELGSLHHLAISDVLTDLYDRRYFDQALRRETERCRRYGTPVSVLLLDLDDFKDVNDRFGHQAGDEVLRQMGDLIRAHVRGADIPCRVGGDEFAIILTGTPQPEALRMAQRLRVGVAAWFSTHEVHGQMLNLTMSGGVATMPLDADDDEELYAGADLALYEAKRRGANQISAVASPGDPPGLAVAGVA
ncbi:MAG TPA: GGDEF domain-containing protein [Gemmatimonadales bacterium]|nr:GGDEF domain-containing protein [Gemmatimonadales bacterium]